MDCFLPVRGLAFSPRYTGEKHLDNLPTAPPGGAAPELEKLYREQQAPSAAKFALILPTFLARVKRFFELTEPNQSSTRPVILAGYRVFQVSSGFSSS
jgi:hypothetical protein